MSVSHHIGLEIAERVFRFVEIQRQDRQTTVLRAEILPTAHDYSSPLLFELPFRQDVARDFIRDLSTVFLRHDVYAQDLSIALPSMLPLVATLPTDKTLDAARQSSLLQWECATLHGSAANERLAILTHPLRQTARTLAVALPEAIVDFLNEVCEHLTLGLATIDTDHFVMENAVRQQYPHEAKHRLAVLGLFPDHCSAGMYTDGEYLGFRQTSVTFKRHYAAQAVQLLESIPGSLAAGQPDHIFVFGPAAGDDVLEALDRILPGTVTRCVPLADSSVPESLLGEMRSVDERQYDVAAAAALLGSS
ncbi:MAG: hypothetical protein KFF77_11100 [Bacteroidetes bacterium]|nr:hypothetical protein [Bacteroidota bacterium]